jgi:N-hydroxyarylamine O-acetyltransferase
MLRSLPMDFERYLKRINFANGINLDERTFVELHEHHVFQVPFENLDIHYKRLFNLELEQVYEKVVENFRGGFCYELNLLFSKLLTEIGFSARVISSRIFDETGSLGPDYDHMSVHVKLGCDYLADVGFGDLFLRPLKIIEGFQYDGRNYFKIEKYSDNDYLLSMSADGITYQSKYTFSLEEARMSIFEEMCFDKQMNPDSFFVKNTICTRPTDEGRVTIFNNKFSVKRGNEKTETMIIDDRHMRNLLSDSFGIVME